LKKVSNASVAKTFFFLIKVEGRLYLIFIKTGGATRAQNFTTRVPGYIGEQRKRESSSKNATCT
jgi:hypothetical protein